MNSYVEDKKRKIVANINSVTKKISDAVNDIVPKKYNKFVEKIDNPRNRRLIKLLPAILVSLTFLAIKNKKLLEPMLKAYQITNGKNLTGPSVIVYTIIAEYVSILKTLGPLDLLDVGVSTIVMILEEIPEIFRNTRPAAQTSQLSSYQRIIQNFNSLRKDLIENPIKRKEEQQRQQELKGEQQKLGRDIKKLIEHFEDPEKEKASQSARKSIKKTR